MEHKLEYCENVHLAIQDTLYVIGGKWKLVILGVLVTKGNKRFGELCKMLSISPRILSKELQELELNNLVMKNVISLKPSVVEYSSTPYAETLRKLIDEMMIWGINHKIEITR